MNGVHDLGGMHGFGKVEPEADEPVFHAPWEGRVLAMSRVLGRLGLWNIDVSRYWIETLPPAFYLGASYYEKWNARNERLAIHHGLITAEELAAGHAGGWTRPAAKPPAQADVRHAFNRGGYERPAAGPARFKPGDRVRTVNINPEGHTRLPRYARNHAGTVEAVRGCHVYPDAVVAGRGEDPQWLYAVVFTGPELWGEGSDPALKVSIEAFEPYLEPAA